MRKSVVCILLLCAYLFTGCSLLEQKPQIDPEMAEDPQQAWLDQATQYISEYKIDTSFGNSGSIGPTEAATT